MRWLITGGAGFIGSNTAHWLLEAGEEVIILDNLFRKGSEKNLQWLQQDYPKIPFLKVDVRDYAQTYEAVAQSAPDVVLHLAAQVAVTSSVNHPREDFEINAQGSFNILEAVREAKLDPIMLYSSTNKVYGNMEMFPVVDQGERYGYAALPEGNPEGTPLDLHSPYGCSKGAADQYFHDYHRIYGLRTVVFRQSCIYGTRQFGVEDQGWVAWFIIAAVMSRPITIYGDGKQVRDLLFVDDLVRGFWLAAQHIDQTQGQIYNIGGGIDKSMAVWTEFCPILEKLLGRSVPVAMGDWRPGDQKVYISNTSKAKADFGWQPEIGVEEGIERLYKWVASNRHLFD